MRTNLSLPGYTSGAYLAVAKGYGIRDNNQVFFFLKQKNLTTLLTNVRQPQYTSGDALLKPLRFEYIQNNV